VLFQQLLVTNPESLPISIAGLVFLWRRRDGPPLRHLAWIYVVLLAMMLIGQKSRPDRIAAIDPMRFAAGGSWRAPTGPCSGSLETRRLRAVSQAERPESSRRRSWPRALRPG